MAMAPNLKPNISMSLTPFLTSPPFSLKTQNSSLFFNTIPSTIQTHKTSFPLRTCTNSQFFSTRRLFLPSVSGIWDAITGGNNPREAVAAIRGGMVLFRQGDVAGSVAEFDKAIELDPRQKAYLWQRGLSLYYLDRFEEGAEQFRIDVAQNPNDTEESIWCFLCEAQLYGVEEARERFLKVGRDPRPVMREAYNMFKGSGDPEKLADGFKNGRDSDYFYASLYAGLYYEAQKAHQICSLFWASDFLRYFLIQNLLEPRELPYSLRTRLGPIQTPSTIPMPGCTRRVGVI